MDLERIKRILDFGLALKAELFSFKMILYRETP